MAILPLVIAPDPRLEIVAPPIDLVDDDIRKLMDDMLETMYANEGIGLAAVQVGVPKRVLVMDIPREDGSSNVYYAANPEILSASSELNQYEEGCLSVPEERAKITRPKKVKVKFLDYNNQEVTLDCDNLLATCIQHEIDHLNGKIFPKYLSKLKYDMVIKRLKKYKKIHNI